MALPTDTIIVAGAAAVGAYLGQRASAKACIRVIHYELEKLREWCIVVSGRLKIPPPPPPPTKTEE